MQDYVDAFEETFNRLAAMDSVVTGDMQVSMLLASFGDKNRSRFGCALSSLQTVQENLDWETATAMLLQEYDEQLLRSGGPSRTQRDEDHTRALYVNRWNGGGRKRHPHHWKKNFRSAKSERRRCYECGKVGHLARDCHIKNGKSGNVPFAGESERESGRAEQAQLLLTQREHTCHIDNDTESKSNDQGMYHFIGNGIANQENVFATAPSALTSMDALERDSRDVFLLDSGASDHMVLCKDWLEDLQKIEPRGIILGNGGNVFATHKGRMRLRTTLDSSGAQNEMIVTLFNVLLVPELHTNLISCSRLCEKGYAINIGR